MIPSSIARGMAAGARAPPPRMAVVLLGAAAFLTTAFSVSAAEKPPTHLIVIQGVQYVPAVLWIRRGDWVQWINKDPFPHTVTAPGTFNSHSIAVGGMWRYRAQKVGEYVYACTLHPNMKGLLQVQ